MSLYKSNKKEYYMWSSKILIAVGLIILSLSTSFATPTPPSGYGQVSVKKWADDRKSAFTFTFDDGFSCDYDYIMPVLDSFGFKGTFFIITSVVTDDLPGIWRYGTWKEFQAMSLDGHEIASHTVTHPDLTTLTTGDINTSGTLLYELYNSKLTVEQKIPGPKCITLDYPYTTYNNNVINNTALYYEAARTGSDNPNDTSLSGSGFYTIGAKEEQFNTPRNSTNDDLDELADIENYMQTSISEGKWGMTMAHEVYPFNQIANILAQGSWYPMSVEWLTSFCQYIKQKSDNNDVWVETMANVTKYMKEREQFKFNILAQTSLQIQISGTTGLNNQIYNYPLTVDITVPSDWQKAIIIQGTKTDTVTISLSGTTAYARTKIVPDGSNITINKQSGSTTLAITGSVTYDNALISKIKNASINISGPNSYKSTVTTDTSGSFSITGLNPGTYTVSLSKSDEFKEVNATDALMVVRYFTGLAQFDSLQALAGDVNNDAAVNSTDALQIVRRFTGTINSFTKPDWIFLPQTINVSLTQNMNLSIKAIITGDVNKSYSP
jgi:peptidoglycan/xylan/chitin deacetylase (PgdA/CDA1 family)